jgi:hypothetical protein
MSSKLRDSSIVPYYDGKLFVEGFAQWVEFKILDHYGYRRNLDEIVFRHYDEYGEGFLALKWLEDHPQGGVQAVIDFMRTAEVTLGNLKLNVDELLESSRVKARILDMQDRFNRNKPPEDMVDIPDVVRPEPGDENQDEPDVDSEIRNYNWDFIPKGDSKKVAQSISLKINKTRYQQFKNRSRLLVEEWNSYAEEEMPEIENLALEMKKIHVKQHWSTYKQASNVLAFVQSSIKYTSDEESTGHKEWPKYPIETLWEQKGDCEDMAILCASIIARLGFQVVLIVYKTHVAFGVSGADKLKGDYLTDPVTDSKYFYGEATARGYYIGEIPMDFVNIQPEAILKVNILIKDD